MERLDPSRKIPPDISGLIGSLAEHEVIWLLAGSYVLTLHGADLAPNDLDVVVLRDTDNLGRLAKCLDDLNAVPFWSGDPKWDLGTPADHAAWRPEPASTRFGMLDIPFALVPDYAELIGGCSKFTVGGHEIDVCDPRSVLVALEPRQRKKDLARQAIYTELRRKFGLLPPVD